MKESKLQQTLGIIGCIYLVYLLTAIVVSLLTDQSLMFMLFPTALAAFFHYMARLGDIFNLFRVICLFLTYGIHGYIIDKSILHIKQKLFGRPFRENKDIFHLILRRWAFPCYVSYVILDLLTLIIIKAFPLPIEELSPWPFTVIGDVFLLIYFRLTYPLKCQNT